VRRWLIYASSGVPFGVTITLFDGRSLWPNSVFPAIFFGIGFATLARWRETKTLRRRRRRENANPS